VGGKLQKRGGGGVKGVGKKFNILCADELMRGLGTEDGPKGEKRYTSGSREGKNEITGEEVLKGGGGKKRELIQIIKSLGKIAVTIREESKDLKNSFSFGDDFLTVGGKGNKG